ncbi:hypothetical protein GUJ93_ZPchr0002g23149 [Zizania palustris]|uniref:Uncharacterized protein n=1 Tax=Zizania palustris TaxID=103762 RepID=A0A8J5S0P2_ZIZPA|nr:hypothetical protein GUJ93_ZPchr0002g23149 [Zizania palustris]
MLTAWRVAGWMVGWLGKRGPSRVRPRGVDVSSADRSRGASSLLARRQGQPSVYILPRQCARYRAVPIVAAAAAPSSSSSSG